MRNDDAVDRPKDDGQERFAGRGRRRRDFGTCEIPLQTAFARRLRRFAQRWRLFRADQRDD